MYNLNLIKGCAAALLLSAAATLNAQVGIGTDNPEATLDIRATNHNGAVTGTDGLLVPRVNDLSTAGTINGQLVYLTADDGTFTAGFHYWNGSAWTPFSGGGGAADGNGIYTGTGDTTEGAHTATLAGDLTFNGSAPGNDVIIGSNSALRTNGAVFRAGISSGAATVDATGDNIYAVELTGTGTQNLNLPDCDPTVNQYREMVLIFGPFMTPGTIKEENSTDGLDKVIAADSSYTIMCSPSKDQWTVTAGGI